MPASTRLHAAATAAAAAAAGLGLAVAALTGVQGAATRSSAHPVAAARAAVVPSSAPTTGLFEYTWG